MRRGVRGGLVLLGLAVMNSRPCAGAFPDGFNHPELTFLEQRTEHFQFIYQAGLDRLVELCGEILEGVYEPICSDLQVWPPERTPVVVTDYDDVGRNFAVRLEHRIYISQPVVNQARLGRRDWLEHLLAHEFAHVVNYWALRRAYGEWGEWAGIELQPQWFTEGLAEYEGSLQSRQENTYALQAARERLLLPLGKMDLASNRIDLVETWQTYAQGHSLVLYLTETYGPDVLRRLLHTYAAGPEFELALRQTIGRGQRKLFQEWVAALMKKQAQRSEQEPQEEIGRPFPTPLIAPLSARWSPDGRKVAVFGIENWEEPVPGLYLSEMRIANCGLRIAPESGQSAIRNPQSAIPGNPQSANWRRISDRLDLFASPQFSWSPEGSRLAYVGRVQTCQGAVRNAIYLYDLRTGKHRRVTGSLRVTDPAWGPTGEWLAFVLYEDETTKLALIRPDGSDLRRITDGAAFQVFQPSWSPAGDQLAVCLIDDTGTDVAILDLNGKIVRRLTADRWPDQYPDWSPVGKTIAFVSYRGDTAALYSLSGEEGGVAGIAANLFCIGVDGSGLQQATRAVSGGIFYPAWLPDGKTLAVSLFRTREADIRLVPAAEGKEGKEEKEGRGNWEIRQLGNRPAKQGKLGNQPQPPEPNFLISQLPSATLGTLDTSPRPYRPGRDFRRLLTRPLTDEDGVGDTVGVRTVFTDSLRKQNLTVEAGYGLDSEEYNYRVRYDNDETRATLGLEVFQRVDLPQSQVGTGFNARPDLGAEEARGLGVSARFPVAPSRSPWIREVFSLGLEMADRDPLGVLVLGPTEDPGAIPRAKVHTVSALWQRDVVRPNRGSSTYLASLTRADTALGSDVDFTDRTAAYVQRWQVPDLRRLVSLGLEVQDFRGESLIRGDTERGRHGEGETREHGDTQTPRHPDTQTGDFRHFRHFDRTLFLGTLRYDWRFADQLHDAWPYAYFGRAWLSASYEAREVLDGEAPGKDARDRATLEFRHIGWLTHGFSYEVRLGQRFFVEGRTDSEFFSAVSLNVRELGF